MAVIRFSGTRASENPDYLVLRGRKPVGALRAFIDELRDRRGRDLTDRQADALIRVTERLITSIEGEAQVVVCKCGKAFSKPIKLTVHLEGSSEIYPACPYCFSRFNENGTTDSAASDDESEVQLGQVTQDVVKEIEICSDTEGRFIFQCAEFCGLLE